MGSSLHGSDKDAAPSSQAIHVEAAAAGQVPAADLEKTRVLLEACRWKDLDLLRALAESRGGFLSDSLRQQAWPILLGLPSGRSAVDKETEQALWKELPIHRDEDQVQLDVDRAFVYYPSHLTDAELSRQKNELSSLITEVLRCYPYLCYFQGYHDICQVFLLVLPSHLRTPAVARLSALRIRDFMLPKLDPAIAQLRLIPDILRVADPALWRHLRGTEPFFALSGTLTMYAHDITTLGEISRLFDVLLAREPVFSIYMFATIVISRREELFDTPADEPEMLHSILSKLPRPLDLDQLITGAVDLFDAHPPERLRAWRAVSSSSVLKTARSLGVCAAQTMQDGEAFFQRQAKEILWLERRKKVRRALWKYRRPVGTLGLAALVAVIAILLRRSSPGFFSGSYVLAMLARWLR